MNSKPMPEGTSSKLPSVPHTHFLTAIQEAHWLNRLNIGSRLTVGFSMLVLLTLVVIWFTHVSNMRAIDIITTTDKLRMPSALLSTSAQSNLLKMRGHIYNYLLLGEPAYKTAYNITYQQFVTDVTELEQLFTRHNDSDNLQRLVQLQKTFATWSELPEQLFTLHDHPLENQPALRLLTEEGEGRVTTILRNTKVMIREQTQRTPSTNNALLLEEMAEFESSFSLMISSLRGYLATTDSTFKYEYLAKLTANTSTWNRLQKKRQLLTELQQQKLDEIAHRRNEFLALPPTLFIIVESRQGQQDLYLFRTRAVPEDELMLALLDTMAQEQQTLLREELATGAEKLLRFDAQTTTWGVVAVVLALLLSWLFRNNIVNPIRRLTHVAHAIAAGDLHAQAHVTASDEIGTLATTFNTMTLTLRTINKKLEGYTYTLEQQVQQRTAALQAAMTTAQEAQAIAEEANHAKSQFLANMSHELRTPLNAIIGYSEMLKEDAIDMGNDDFVPDLEKIYTAGKHLLDIINDILDISKIEAGKMDLYVEVVELSSLLDNVMTTIRPLVAKNDNTLTMSLDDTVATMYTDQTKLRQILLNLLSNATKFTKQGTITLTVQRVPNEVPSQPERITFCVADTGIGISHENLNKLFKAFTQADVSTTRKFGGTGLGLAISQRYSHMMGGMIAVESEEGVGSTFTLMLPIQTIAADEHNEHATNDETHEVTTETSATTDGHHAMHTVLVIDDDEMARDVMTRQLNTKQVRVVTAASGAEGVQLAKEILPDVITLDVMMPEMDGWTVLAALKSDPDLCTIPVIMMTLLQEQEMGFALGASDYLMKPVDREQLLQVVRKYDPLNQGNVLIVEDDPMTQELLRHSLEKEGWRVKNACNGREALEYIAIQQPDVLLLDLMIPDVDGFEVIATLRTHPTWQNIPIVVITAMELTIEQRHFLTMNVSHILQKATYSCDELLMYVSHLVKNYTQHTE